MKHIFLRSISCFPRFLVRLPGGLAGAILFMLVGLIAGTPSVQAADFYSSLTSTHTISAQGETTVAHSFLITNKQPTLYITQYGLKISAAKSIKNVVVTSNGQKLPANVVTAGTVTSIGITFPDVLVGEGKTREFTVTYQNPDTALINGQVLEVHVPQLTSSGQYDHYEVVLITPARFGQPIRTSPTASSVTPALTPGAAVVTTKFINPQQQTISAFFGSEQIFELKLKYHLSNDSDRPALTQIALPPDTSYQKLLYSHLEPLPESIAPDGDGNWLATYQLPARSQVEVFAAGQAFVSLDARADFPVVAPESRLVSSQKYWESNNSELQKLAQQHQTPQDINNFVVNTLTYFTDGLENFPEGTSLTALPDTIERLGAVQSLARPTQATCQEFTDLFIALARANKVPSRRLTGYAVTQNNALRPLSLVTDVLHAWPEYYDYEQQRWIQIDPTWEKTTGGIDYFHQFDLNHVVFAINGESSTAPFPAGSYKPSPDYKDVDVSFGTTFELPKPQLQLSLEPQIWSGVTIPGRYILSITNPTGVAWHNLSATITLPEGLVFSPATHTESVLLPWQAVHVPLTVYTRTWFKPQTLTAQVNYEVLSDQSATGSLVPPPITNDKATSTEQAISADQTTSAQFSLTAAPWAYVVFTHPSALLTLGISSTAVTLITGSVLVFRRRRSSALRRQGQKS